MYDTTHSKLSSIAGQIVKKEAGLMRRATRRVTDDEQAPQTQGAAQSDKGQPLSIGLSLLVWAVMAALAWGAVMLVVRLF